MKCAVLTLVLAALLLGAGPLLDERDAAQAVAASIADAQDAARNADTMARWSRRVCGNAEAVTLQVEADDVACLDASGRRVGTVAIASKGMP